VKTRYLVAALVLSLGINVGALSVASYHRLAGYREREHRAAGWVASEKTLDRELGLSANQGNRIEKLRGELEAKIDAYQQQLRTVRSELFAVMREQSPNTELINQKLAQISNLQLEIQKVVVDYLLREKQILTPQQQEKFVEILEERVVREEHHDTQPIAPGVREQCPQQ